jgi:uncharacterized damage-inducible protein DinB
VGDDRRVPATLDTGGSAVDFSRERRSGTQTFTRQWVVWHLVEHDLHHGGEVSLILGSHGLTGLDL